MHRYGLREDQWDRIKNFLPGREGHVGGTAADNRRFVEAVIDRYRTGIPWRDLPECYGDWKATHKRFRRWCKSGVFERIFRTLGSDADADACSCRVGSGSVVEMRRELAAGEASRKEGA